MASQCYGTLKGTHRTLQYTLMHQACGGVEHFGNRSGSIFRGQHSYRLVPLL